MTLRRLFLDMNSFFASVEQQEKPHLRGMPVAVVPVLSDTTSCIAASYEAKAYGIRTGTNVGEARMRCPNLQLVVAEHGPYKRYHDLIVNAVSECIPIERVLSVDEMVCGLCSNERSFERSREIGWAIKETIYRKVGKCLRCSVGIGPNTFIAKMAAELKKPDGLEVIDAKDLPGRLLGLELLDFPGINKRMERRFRSHGVFRVDQMYALSMQEMNGVYCGVTGERWWRLIRGEEIGDPQTERKSVGHSYVLPPEMRTRHGASVIALRLLEKAAERMRHLGFHARTLNLNVSSFDDSTWKSHIRFGPSQNLWTLQNLLSQNLDFPIRRPVKVSITLGDLIPDSAVTLSLFPDDQRHQAATKVIDQINRKFGRGAIWPASLAGVRMHAGEKIAFSKVSDLV